MWCPPFLAYFACCWASCIFRELTKQRTQAVFLLLGRVTSWEGFSLCRNICDSLWVCWYSWTFQIQIHWTNVALVISTCCFWCSRYLILHIQPNFQQHANQGRKVLRNTLVNLRICRNICGNISVFAIQEMLSMADLEQNRLKLGQTQATNMANIIRWF